MILNNAKLTEISDKRVKPPFNRNHLIAEELEDAMLPSLRPLCTT